MNYENYVEILNINIPTEEPTEYLVTTTTNTVKEIDNNYLSIVSLSLSVISILFSGFLYYKYIKLKNKVNKYFEYNFGITEERYM